MKTLFNLIIVALTVAAGWYAHPNLIDWAEKKKESTQKAKAAEGTDSSTAKTTDKNVGAGPETAAASAARELAESLRKSSPQPANQEVPNGSSTSPSTSKPVVAAADEFELKYPLPVFKEITEITNEWTSIPSRAFPRTVKTLVPLQLEGTDGKVPLPENSQALAVGMTQGMLVLMKNRENPARSLVPLANTDLKETLTTLYEKYKKYKIEEVMQQRERARGLKARANGATDAELAAAGPKPAVESGGVITAMIKSLRAKEITETSEDRIMAWGGLNIEKIGGMNYWTGTIQCTVDNAIFGPTPTELMALIRDDKVVKWLYSGSKEEVQ